MSLFSIPDDLLPSKTMLDEVMKQTDALKPAEFTGTVNFMAQPLAGAAAMSALSVSFASHAIGVWWGTMTAATTASQRMFLPMFDGFALDGDVLGDSAQKLWARDDAATLPAVPQSAADSVKQRTRKKGAKAPGDDVAGAVETADTAKLAFPEEPVVEAPQPESIAEAPIGIHSEEPAPVVELASVDAPEISEAVFDQAVEDAVPTTAAEAAVEDVVAAPVEEMQATALEEMPATAVEEPSFAAEVAPVVAVETVAEQVIEEAAPEAVVAEDVLAKPVEEMQAAAVEEMTAAEPAVEETLAAPVEEMPTATVEDVPAAAADDTLATAAEEAPVLAELASQPSTDETFVAEAAPVAEEPSAPLAAPAVAEHSAPASLMPEDFRKPAAMEKPEQPDDLKAIAGVGPKLEKVLNDIGVWTYAQIAAWQREEIAWVDDTLGFKGRIDRDDWLTQAAKFASAKTGTSE